MHWLEERRTPRGVRERTFEVHHAGGAVPGALWTPEGDGAVPLVLIGHGGAGHKRDESRVDLGERYVLEHGVAAVAIDGPAHGDRAGGTLDLSSRGVDAMVTDWRETLDVLVALEEVDGERIGYGGVSMGTIFGLPLVAAEPRIRAAVLGLCGFSGPAHDGATYAERLRADAPRVRCPTLFVVQWDDELFDREGAFALFELLGAEDRRLLAHPGLHHETPEHVRDATTRFLAEQLRAVET